MDNQTKMQSVQEVPQVQVEKATFEDGFASWRMKMLNSVMGSTRPTFGVRKPKSVYCKKYADGRQKSKAWRKANGLE